MTRGDAIEFAEECQQVWSVAAFRVFAEVYTFANTLMKMSRDDAQSFASDWMDRDDHDQFPRYRRAFEFARAREGLGLGVERAGDFVEAFDRDHGIGYFERFQQAFGVARGAGRSRSDAEDYAFGQL